MNRRIGIMLGVGLSLLYGGLIYSGATLDFLGEQIKKGAELAHETVVKGGEAVSTDIASGLETARKGFEGAAEGVAAGAEAARDAAARGAAVVGDVTAKGVEVVYQATKPVTDVVVEGAKTAADVAKKGVEAVSTIVVDSATKISEVIAEGTRVFYEGARSGAEFVIETTRPVTDAAILASNAFAGAVASALQGGLHAVRSGAEFVGSAVSEGGQTVVKAAGKSIQFVGEQVKQAGVIVEEGAERAPQELQKFWDSSQMLINRALHEGWRRAQEVPKLVTGAAAVLVKNSLPEAVMLKTPGGDLLELNSRESIFAGAQMRVVFVKDQSAFVVYNALGIELCTLHTGFDGDLLWVNVTSPDAPENVRAYVGGHNGAATYHIAPGLKVKIDWWLNSSKYFLHDFYFELLPA